MGNNKWANKLTFWQNFEIRKRGKQKSRWWDGFKNLIKNELFHRIAQDWREWARLGEAVALL